MLKKIEDMNFYELLEVSPRATAQEIHKAYERVRKIYDPNSIALYSLFSPDETEKIRNRVEEAYRTLIYEENRRDYDQALHGGIPAPEPRPKFRAVLPSPQVRRAEPPVERQPPVRHAEPRPVPAAPPTPTIPTVLQPVPPDITECTGSIIKMLREQRGLTIRNIADITKLGSRHLEHIEDELFPKLPARPYLRGFLFTFARTLGYEPERIVNDYMKRYDAAMNPPKK